MPCWFVLAATWCLLSCGEEVELPVVEGTLEQVLKVQGPQVAGADDPAARKAAIETARLQLGGWWKGQDNRFTDWTGHVSALRWCPTSRSACMELSVDILRGDSIVRLSHVDVGGHEAVNAAGKPTTSVGWLDPIDPTEEPFRALLAAKEAPLHPGSCVVVTGRVNPGMQPGKDGLARAEFFADFESLRPCTADEAPSAPSSAPDPVAVAVASGIQRQLGLQAVWSTLPAITQRQPVTPDDREALNGWWGPWNGQFTDWRVRVTDLEQCGWLMDKDCLVLTMELGQGSHRVTIRHPDLKDTVAVDRRGRQTKGFGAYKELTTDNPGLRPLVREAPSSSGRHCALASGTLYDGIQEDEDDGTMLYANITSLKPCAKPKVALPVAPFTQESVMGFLAHLRGQYDRADNGQERILEHDADAVMEEILTAANRRLENWRGTVTYIRVDAGNETEMKVDVGCDSCASDTLEVQLRWYKGNDAMSETLLRAKEGACVVFSGAVADKDAVDNLVDDDPTLRMKPDALSLCQGGSTGIVKSDKQLEEENRRGVAAGAAVVGAVGGVAAASTGTVVATLTPVITANGSHALLLGTKVVGSSSFSAASFLGPAAVAAVGFYYLDKHISKDRKVKEAHLRTLHMEDGEEYLAMARHACTGKSLNSTCVRQTFREAATFVAASYARVSTILGKIPAKSDVQKRWIEQWEVARKYDPGALFFDMKQVIKRVGDMSEGVKKSCRDSVDQAHLMMSERRILYNGRVDDGKRLEQSSEHLFLGSCFDLFMLENDYLEQEGVYLIWRDAFITEYGNTDHVKRSAQGWSAGEVAASCREGDKKAGWFSGCEIRLFAGKAQCVCDGTPLAAAVRKRDEKAWNYKSSQQKRFERDRDRGAKKVEKDAARAKRDQAKKDKAEMRRLLREEKKASRR